jgi:hypothetical protein
MEMNKFLTFPVVGKMQRIESTNIITHMGMPVMMFHIVIQQRTWKRDGLRSLL